MTNSQFHTGFLGAGICQGQIPTHTEQVKLAMQYHVPECFLCWGVHGDACPKQAIDVEYDDIDVREHLVSIGNPTTLTEV